MLLGQVLSTKTNKRYICAAIVVCLLKQLPKIVPQTFEWQNCNYIPVLQGFIVLKTYLKYTICKTLVHICKHGKCLLRLKVYLKWWKLLANLLHRDCKKTLRSPALKSTELTFLKVNMYAWVVLCSFLTWMCQVIEEELLVFGAGWFFVVVAFCVGLFVVFGFARLFWGFLFVFGFLFWAQLRNTNLGIVTPDICCNSCNVTVCSIRRLE